MSPSRGGVWGIVVVLGVALGAGVSGCAASRADDGLAAASKAARVPLAESPYVGIHAAAAEDFVPRVHAPGRIALRDGAAAQVATPVAGRIVAVQVQVGDHVKAGQPLVTVDSPDAAARRAELGLARAELRAAEDGAARQRRMVAAGVGVEVERAAAETRLAQARTALTRAEQAVAFFGQEGGTQVLVRAPMAGVVLERSATVGANVEPSGGALAVVGSPDALWVVARVFERDLSRLAPGERASVTVASRPEPLEARVVRVGSEVDPATRRAPVVLELTGAPASGLRAGMYANVDISEPARRGIVLPVEAVLIKEEGRTVVYVDHAGKLAPQAVTLGDEADERVEIVAGLAAGDRVVERGALLVDSAASQLH